MNKGPHIDSELLARYLSGESDAVESAAVQQWVSEDPANGQELDAMRAVWDLSGEGYSMEVDVEAALRKVNERIGSEGITKVIPIQRRIPVVRWLAAAAVIAGVFMGVRFLLTNNSITLMATTEYQRTTLPDSSRVILSPGSSIKAKLQRERRVALVGEAYFEVKRDEQRPFIVEADGVTVTVLGTAFEVSAFDTSNSVMVRVRHGKVRVVAGMDSVVLQGGEYARYNKGAHFLERMPAPPSEVWGDRIIQFHDTPLAQVVEQLQSLFKVRVQLGNGALARCKLTATFEDEPIDYILRVIADTYGATLNMEAIGSYTLNGDGC